MFGNKFLALFGHQTQEKIVAPLKNKIKLQSVLICIPYLWSILFFLIPTILVLKISLAKACMELPPFSTLFHQIGNNFYSIYVYFGNYAALFTDSFYFSAIYTSFLIAGVSTVFCLIIGYSMAYAISLAPKRVRMILILLVVLPFVTSFLIRVYSWMSLLNTQGIINHLLMKIGIIQEPLCLLDNNCAVCLGVVYCYLPFMILPIYAALDKIDESYIEAALDLGATNYSTFWHITVPLSLPGVFAGCTLVFIPALGEFVIPELLGGAKTVTIGQTIWAEFFNNRDWPLACAIAVLMMASFVFYTIITKIKVNLMENKGR